ncbi:hypothetical protein YC2023_022588 [Brassica napus]
MRKREVLVLSCSQSFQTQLTYTFKERRLERGKEDKRAIAPASTNVNASTNANGYRSFSAAAAPRCHTHPTSPRTNSKIYRPRRASRLRGRCPGEPTSLTQACRHQNLHKDGAKII